MTASGGVMQSLWSRIAAPRENWYLVIEIRSQQSILPYGKLQGEREEMLRRRLVMQNAKAGL